VTHLHGDHYAGIPFLILDGQFRRRDRSLTIVGPAGTRARLRAAMDALYPGMAEIERRFAVHVVELQPSEPAKIEGAIVTGAPALGLQLGYGGRTVAYTGDTEWTAALPAVADGADLLVAEAYTWNRRIRYHLDWETLSSHRAELRCGQLALTHMSDDMLAKISDLPADVIVAQDGLRISL
jgi:ribonuclease BN (tRNA processing enzyme)